MTTVVNSLKDLKKINLIGEMIRSKDYVGVVRNVLVDPKSAQSIWPNKIGSIIAQAKEAIKGTELESRFQEFKDNINQNKRVVTTAILSQVKPYEKIKQLYTTPRHSGRA